MAYIIYANSYLKAAFYTYTDCPPNTDALPLCDKYWNVIAGHPHISLYGDTFIDDEGEPKVLVDICRYVIDIYIEETFFGYIQFEFDLR